MTYNSSRNDFDTSIEPFTGLGDPQALADITGGHWTTLPKIPLTTLRHRLDTVEAGQSGFLFAPELFTKLNGTHARAALLSCGEALAKGAGALLVSAYPRNLDSGIPCLVVATPARAIEKLARHRRSHSNATFFAITGSVGKSTTRSMIHLLAGTAGPAYRSIANYNAGMESIYFTLAGLSDAHRYCIAEFSEVGNLEDQASFYRPDISVITNIFREHMDRVEQRGYKGDKAIERLTELAAGIVRHLKVGGTCVLCKDMENFPIIAREVLKSPHVNLRTCGAGADCDVRIISMECGLTGSDITIEVDGKQHSYHLGIPGHHMAMNSVLAASAIHFAGIDLALALPVLAKMKPDARRFTRSQLPWKGGSITLLDDSISSSVPSLRSAFEQMKLIIPEGEGRRIAVLGQINGVGENQIADLSTLAAEAEAGPIDRFYTIGLDTRFFNEAFKDRDRVADHFQTLAKLEVTLKEEIKPGDVVLFKSTRTPANIAMRRLVSRLVNETSEAVELTVTTEPARRLVIGGDTYFGEYYQERRVGAAEVNFLSAKGYDYSANGLRPIFARADFSVVNLECTLTNRTISELRGRKDYILHAHPERTIAALKALNIKGVLLGNNHAMDYAAGGLEDTLSALEKAELLISGAGRGRQDAQKPITITLDVEGIDFKIAILSGYEYNDSHEEMKYYAGDTRLGVNNINFPRIRKQIAQLRSNGYFVIVSPHWGTNYCFRNYSQTQMAQRLVDAGADLILGHGPHFMNEIASVDGVWVAYSLGNLIFNSEGEYERRKIQPYSLVSEIELHRRGSSVCGLLNLYPIVSCNKMTQFRPTFVDDEQFQNVVLMLTSCHYDGAGLREVVRFHKKDGRHCLSARLF